jgi:alkylation response protein AidB-like acyl-CoA dehydrogenase
MLIEEIKTSADFVGVRDEVTDILASYDFLPTDEARVLPHDVLERLGKAKAFGLCAKSEHGGAQLSLSDANAVIAAAAAFDASVASALVIHNYLSTPCLDNASDLVDRDGILRKTASGEALCAFALTEHGAGSAPRFISATATMTETGYRINGTKIWIGLGAWASNVVCFAKVPEQGNRVSAFLVDTQSEGFSVQVEHRTMGLRGIVQNTLNFENVEVPFDRCLSGHGNGYSVAKNSMNKGRLGVASMSLGIARRATQIVTLYVSQRKIGSQFLIDNPYIQDQVGGMVQRIACMERILRFAETTPNDEPLAEYMATVAKVICSEWANEITNQALQFLGGRGYEEDLIVGKLYRDARIMRIFEGPTEVLLTHLERMFSSRATASMLAEAFAGIDAEDLFLTLKDRFDGEHSRAAGREVHRGWAIALSLALGVCRAGGPSDVTRSLELCLTGPLTGVLERLATPAADDREQLSRIIEDFMVSTNVSIRKPDFDRSFMVVRKFD